MMSVKKNKIYMWPLVIGILGAVSGTISAKKLRVHNAFSSPILCVLVETARGLSMPRYTKIYRTDNENNTPWRWIGTIVPGGYADVENFDQSLLKYDRTLWVVKTSDSAALLRSIKRGTKEPQVTAYEMGSKDEVAIIGADKTGKLLAKNTTSLSQDIKKKLDNAWAVTQKAALDVGIEVVRGWNAAADAWDNMEAPDMSAFTNKFKSLYHSAAQALSPKKPVVLENPATWHGGIQLVEAQPDYQGTVAAYDGSREITFVEACKYLGIIKPEEQRFLALYNDELSEKEKVEARRMIQRSYESTKKRAMTTAQKKNMELSFSLMKIYVGMDSA